MKTLNLFLKMHFTSLSPDGQPISLAIVTSDYYNTNDSGIKGVVGGIGSKSFYAEFTDYDINRCDDWVKSNVVSKLNINSNGIPKGYDNLIGFDGHDFYYTTFQNSKDRMPDDRKTIYGNSVGCFADSKGIKSAITNWLSQFSDSKLNFIVDCGWFTWYKFVELMGEWECIPNRITIIEENGDEFSIESISKLNTEKWIRAFPNCKWYVSSYLKIGLPKLPANFPPIPKDLNELIAFKRGITVSEAFELDLEEYLYENLKGKEFSDKEFRDKLWNKRSERFNALWDAKVTKAIYEKLT